LSVFYAFNWISICTQR